MKKDMHIEIVRSSIPSLSSMGQKSCDLILAVLKKNYAHVGVSIVDDIEGLDAVVAKKPDLVFLGLKHVYSHTRYPGIHRRKIWVAAYLQKRGINFTGSAYSAIQLDYDKPASKQVVHDNGLPTSPYFMASNGEYTDANDLPLSFPLFIKPPFTGGGSGIGADSIIHNFSGFEHQVMAISNEYSTDALVESYLPGREFSVALLQSANSDELFAMPIELIAEKNEHGDRILGYAAKKDDKEQVAFVSDPAIHRMIVRLARNVFSALGARDYGRIDIRLSEHGVANFLEANLVPGLALGYFVRACSINLSMSYDEVILHIAELGLARSNVHRLVANPYAF